MCREKIPILKLVGGHRRKRTPSAKAVSELSESGWDSRIGLKLIQAVCRDRRPVGISKALSLDPRERVLVAICWRDVVPTGGGAVRGERVERDPLAGACPRSGRRETQGSGRDAARAASRRMRRWILRLVEGTPDITLVELRSKLASRGVGVGVATLWRFFERRRIALKKRRRTPPSRIARTS